VKRRGAFTIGLLIVAALGVIGASAAARPRPFAGNVGSSYVLLFDSLSWMIAVAPFAGVLAGALTRRTGPRIEGERVLRHDGAAILAHWTHGLGTAALLVTGIALGFLFVPRLVDGFTTAGLLMNLHFVAVVFFLFGTFYWMTNTLLATKRFREHLPTGHAIDFTVQHYGLLLGFKKFKMPPEDKYFESERMAFILALAATGLIILSGMVKVAAHVWNIPGALAGAATLTHDVATILMAAFFLAHIFFAAVLPMSWPVLRSMFTGYVTLEHAETEHAGWLARLRVAETEPDNVVHLDEATPIDPAATGSLSS
jgi:formate dehydrogenase subunit gamma